MTKILVIEDDSHINQMICEALSKAGYLCTGAYSGTEGMLLVRQESDAGGYSLIILDLMLPGMDGEEFLKQLRQSYDMPVIVLSAKDELDTKVDLLTLGANDYMTKPFELKELQARVLVQLRSAKTSVRSGQIQHRDLCYDIDEKKVTVNGQELPLTAQELKIMELLLRHPGKVFSKNEIYQYAWEEYYIGEDKTINVHISNIRQKLKKQTDAEYIETVWGLGFKLIL